MRLLANSRLVRQPSSFAETHNLESVSTEQLGKPHP